MQKYIQTLKGTKDLFDLEILKHDYVINHFSKICGFFCFRKIATPLIENVNVFSKSLGERSDIISKEMYNFVDQGGDSIILRPEGTAAVCRALISNSLQDNEIKKFFYSGPMFRREKPQSGRLRQFHQVGIESFGELNFLHDLESIMIAEKFLSELGIRNSLQLEINTLGNSISRNKYNKVLKNFFYDNKKNLSEESKRRLDKNPLRILDSKDSKDKQIVVNSPKIYDYLDTESKDFFEKLIIGLNDLKINYKINPNLVRGLDYYSHTAFEYASFVSKRQNTILAGGRYDGLVESLGGKSIGGVGWAAGIERILLSMQKKFNKKKIISFFCINDERNKDMLSILDKLKTDLTCKVYFINSGNVKKKFSRANKIGSSGCIILGDEEWAKKMLIWKDFLTGKQESFMANKINNFLKELI